MKSLLGVLKINADFLQKVTYVTNYYAEFVMLAMLPVENQRIYLLNKVRISLSENQAAEGSIC